MNVRSLHTQNTSKSLPGRSLDVPGRSRRGQNRAKIEQKSSKIALGAILANQGFPGTCPERSQSGLGDPRGAPWTLPGGSQDVLGRSREAPGRSQDASESARSEFFARPLRNGLLKGLQSEFRAIFRRPRVDAGQLRCARYISFIGSEAQSQHVRLASTRARRSIEKTAISTSKIEPGRSKMTPERAKSRPNGQVRAKKRSQSATQPAERIFFSQSNAAGRPRERNAAPPGSARRDRP